MLVDQRGGRKVQPLELPLRCQFASEMTEERGSACPARRCLDEYDADVRLYTTDIAMDDLDDVRAVLGHDRINLYGGSHGTRAALVYLRQHGEHVRSIVLDGVAPTDMRLPLFTARDAQHALDKALADCEAESACNGTFPAMASRIRNLITSLDRHPRHVRIVHPRTGIAEDVDVDARLVSSVIFNALYSPLRRRSFRRSSIALRRTTTRTFALALAGEGAGENMSIGMQLGVVQRGCFSACLDELAHQTSKSVFGSHLIGSQLEACAIWPRGNGPRRLLPSRDLRRPRSCCRARSIPSRRLSGANRS